MTEPPIRTLSEKDALDRIEDTVQHAGLGEAPFALVLGAGFSHGLVPTARELVNESLPLWAKSQKGDQTFDTLKQAPPDQRTAIAREFWADFVRRNPSCNPPVTLDPDTSLPADHTAAYMAAFDSDYTGAVGAPADARKFQRTLMRLDQPRLNAAHFLLASLLGVQPRRSSTTPLFKARAAFCRLILTTNFDPFLQTALQAVNRLYFMSDTPDLGLSDDVLDDHTDAIHLVYLHGSIHRRLQATSTKPIEQIKKENAQTLASCLKRRGVIVLGYSGWEDVVVQALAMCEQFDHRLYWCGLETDALTKNAFGPHVPEILRKPTAQYVRIAGAGHFMKELLKRLTGKLPRLLDTPIGQLRDLLDMIDLRELEKPRPAATNGPDIAQLPLSGNSEDAFVQAKRSMLVRLERAQLAFDGQTPADPSEEALVPNQANTTQAEAQTRATPVVPPMPDSRARASQLLSSAKLAVGMDNYPEALNLCDEVLGVPGLEVPDRAEAWMLRARAQYFAGRMDEAIADWTRIVELEGVPVEKVAWALLSRGLAWRKKGETDKALADYTRLIEQLRGAPVDPVAWALINRGLEWRKKGETDKALADYTRVIERLPAAPVAPVAWALTNRGIAWGQKGETAKALADYMRVIEQLPGAPVAPVAHALANRGCTRYENDDYCGFLADTEAALSKLPSLDVAAFNLGLALLACGRDPDALAAYRRAGQQFPDKIDTLALPGLADACKKWLSDERAEPVTQLLQSLKN